MRAADILRKPYARMVLSDGAGGFAAEIVEFPGCYATGSTAAEALTNLDEVAAEWIAATLAHGQDIPEPMDSINYSGKFVVRMPPGLHRRVALCAHREAVSLNQFVVTCIAEAVGERARPTPWGVVALGHEVPRIAIAEGFSQSFAMSSALNQLSGIRFRREDAHA